MEELHRAQALCSIEHFHLALELLWPVDVGLSVLRARHTYGV